MLASTDLAAIVLTGAGTSSAPITIRGYPGETVIFDLAQYATSFRGTYDGTDGWTLIKFKGTHVYLRDVSIINSYSASRLSCGGIKRADAIHFQAAGGGCINCRIYDNWQAWVSNTQNADNYTLRGSLIINNGMNGPDGPAGHAGYLEHDELTEARLEGNLFLHHFNSALDNGSNANGGRIQSYSQSGNAVRNLKWDGNTFTGLMNVLFQSTDLSGDWITNNRFYNNRTGFTFAEDVGSGCQTNVKFTGNHFHDVIFNWRFTAGAEFTNNVFATRNSSMRWTFDTISTAVACDTFGELFSTLNNNTYYQNQTGNLDFNELVNKGAVSNTNVTFSNWQADTGKDANSTRITSLYPAISQGAQSASATNYIYTWASPDEPGLAHITVYNYKGSSTVSFDPSTVLPAGAPYEIIDDFCYNCGPIATGIVAGNISLPMTLTAVTEPVGPYTLNPITTCPGADASNHGIPYPQFTHPSSEFGVFTIRRQRTNSSRSYTVTNSTPGSTHVRLKLGLSSTNLNWPTVTAAIANGSTGNVTTDAHWPGIMYRQFDYLDASGNVLASSSVQSDSTASVPSVKFSTPATFGGAARVQ
jgi:hypothetical protein